MNLFVLRIYGFLPLTYNPAMKITYKSPVRELVQKRYSCRTYSMEGLEPSYVQALDAAASKMQRGLLGEKAEFQVISKREAGDSKFADYGLIKGARSFLIGRITLSDRAYESYGYLLEQLVLKATDLGLETVWVGYFHPQFFAEVKLRENEVFPAAIVVGHSVEKRRFMDRVVRTYLQARSRQPWPQLFFEEDFQTPLTEAAAGSYSLPLDLVRLAPSSGNIQPWRIVKERNKPVFHFFMKKVKKAYALRRLHEVDIGIAMAHFELGAEQSELAGDWVVTPPNVSPPVPDVIYRWTWIDRPTGTGF
jgi:nitroreductase